MPRLRKGTRDRQASTMKRFEQLRAGLTTRQLSDNVHAVTGVRIDPGTLDRILARGECSPRYFVPIEQYVTAKAGAQTNV